MADWGHLIDVKGLWNKTGEFFRGEASLGDWFGYWWHKVSAPFKQVFSEFGDGNNTHEAIADIVSIYLPSVGARMRREYKGDYTPQDLYKYFASLLTKNNQAQIEVEKLASKYYNAGSNASATASMQRTLTQDLSKITNDLNKSKAQLQAQNTMLANIQSEIQGIGTTQTADTAMQKIKPMVEAIEQPIIEGEYK